MAELPGQEAPATQFLSRGLAPNARVVQLELTCRQQRYAQRCVGIARFVYNHMVANHMVANHMVANRMVANDQAGRDVDLWLTPHELEQEFNAVKQSNPSLAFVTEVSKFVARGACRNYRNARSRWLNKNLKARRDGIPQEEPHRHGIVPGRLRREAHPLRPPPADPAALPEQRQDDPFIAGRHTLRGTHRETEWPLVCQHCLLETAHNTAPTRNSIGGRGGRGHQSPDRG